MRTQVDAVAARRAARAERRRLDRVRAHRVRRLRIEPCHVCGGIPDDVDLPAGAVDPALVDETLECQCAARRALLLAHVERLAYERGTARPAVRDRVAP